MSYRDVEDLIEDLDYIRDSYDTLRDNWNTDTFLSMKDTLLKALDDSGIQIDEDLRAKINNASSDYSLNMFCNEIGFKIADYIRHDTHYPIYRNLRQVPEGRNLAILLQSTYNYIDSVSSFSNEIDTESTGYIDISSIILNNGIDEFLKSDLFKSKINNNLSLLTDSEKSDFIEGLNLRNPISIHIFNAINDYELKRQYVKDCDITARALDVFYKDKELQSTILLEQLKRSEYFEEDIDTILKKYKGIEINLSNEEMNEYVDGIRRAFDRSSNSIDNLFELKKTAFSIISSESKMKYIKSNIDRFEKPLDSYYSSELRDFILTYGAMAATMTDDELEQLRFR